MGLGSGCGLNFGRQAAWRPDAIGIVSSSLLAALWKQLLCSVIVIKSFDGKRGILRSSSCLAARLRSLGKSFESMCASVQRPLSWIPPSAVLRLELSRVPQEPCRRVRRGAGSSLPCAALPSLSESSMAAEFLRVRECMMDRRTLETKRQWSTFDGEVLLRTCTPLRQCVHGNCACGSRHASLRRFG